MRLAPTFRGLAFVILCGASLAVTASAGKHLEQRPRPPEEVNDPVYLPRVEFLRAVSLGFHNAMADLLWFRTISYFGEHYRADRTYPWLADMCDLVTDLDPKAFHVYRFAGVILPWEAGQADAGIRLLEKGTHALPDSWLLQFWLGFNYYFFKNDYAEAARHMRLAAELPGASRQVARFAALLYAEQYGPEMSLQFLKEMERDADSREMREVIEENVKEAQLEVDLTRLNRAVAAYRRRFGMIPLTLWGLVDTGLINTIPPDPFGGTYEIDLVSGAVRSSTGHVPRRLGKSKLRQRQLQGRSVRDD
jgi:hypothetical protein